MSKTNRNGKPNRGFEVVCAIHGVTYGYGGADRPKCLACARRAAEARRTGKDLRDLLRADLEARRADR